MDAIVQQAMARWPDVPDVYGWLARDGRGRWLIRGERLEHAATLEFILRNYQPDERGAWFFQNGPQRVFVSLATAPLTGRLMPDGRVCTGTPADFQPRQAFLTPDGDCYLLAATAHAALLDGADLAAVSFINAQGRLATDADWEHGPGPGWQLQAGRFCLPLQTVSQEAIPMQCGFLRQPYP
ncbi:DUF2946 family protein [Laribacter hongkongensis]|uniref:DUF2946 family protein n=1 Tax=Laribacter hongkongensis TaxID=168471 RepID=A0ABD4SPK8_9NEIS|nr:DUF2946 family protein [Laribacter hongkongensis]MCG9024769.1 DUF2946 family protein [Laribacter hongkongensis]MCG9100806.1 DUF2946 family protein [Laribacter hongkongensis]MCG9102180.1 DUF2946 family protein [Laribacter hongkongensis]MCG9112214.1 DUF2946 family protein [Laribacter hongkongensis]MCG9118828.1 DUF2946 family protein [Laribacter hongkongensis]